MVSYNTFYKSWHDAMKNMPAEDYKKLSIALHEYCFNGVVPENLTGIPEILFIAFKPSIDSSTNNKLNGKKGGKKGKGGAPKGNRNAKNKDEAQNEPTLKNNSPLPCNQYPPIEKTIAPLEKNNSNVNVKENVNENEDENVNVSDKEFTPKNPQEPAGLQSFPTANAVDIKITPVSASPPIKTGMPASQPPPENAVIPASQSLPKKNKSKKDELSAEHLALFHAAKACFEVCEKTKAMMYQDRETTARDMHHLKTLVIRCKNMAPGITAGFLQNVLEHFRVICNGKLKGKAEFTPRALITPWIWELVIGSLPEADDELTAGIRKSISGMFK